MKIRFALVSTIALMIFLSACRSTKKLNTAIASKDTVLVLVKTNNSNKDSVDKVKAIMTNLLSRKIDFTTFSAKIKVDYEDSKGKQPDVNVFVRLHKDSIMWLSVNASFLSIEAFRVLIRKDSVFVLNKLDKIYEQHSMDFIQEISKIPLNFFTLQVLILGYPIFLDTNIVSYKQTENRLIISTIGKYFKNLLTITAETNLIEKSKLDDLDVARNQTADLTYSDYENKNGVSFATGREITVSEKTKVDVVLKFKQWDFNKELTYPFSVPKNYKRK